MRESTFEQPLPRALQSKVATPYQADGSPVAGGPHVYPELAAAGLWTTPSDLARYAIGMQRVLAGKAPRVMAASTAQEMLTPVIGQQAIGWVVGGAKENAYFRHGGANAGYRCLLVAYQHGDGVAIMSNSDSGDGLMLEILRTVAHEYGWPDHAPPVRIPGAVSPESFDPFAGAYRLDSGAEVTFWREGSRIRYRIFAQPAEELYATSEREYFLKTSEVRWTFSQPATPAEPAAVLYQSERKHPAQRLSGTESEIVLRNALETQKRFDEQRPDPDSENALRHWIDEVKSGAPDYDRMQPELAKIVRNKLPELQAALSQFGVVQTVRFKAVNAAGGDSFDIDFERGQRQFEILLRADRRIHDVRFTP
jgi:hypothetical protein